MKLVNVANFVIDEIAVQLTKPIFWVRKDIEDMRRKYNCKT